MSTELIHKEIQRFLESEDAEVLCIKGAWGVGKTFAWNAYLKEVASNQRLGLKHYSYVSLFGLNSLDSLRYAIFEGTVTEDQIDSGPTFDSLAALWESALTIGRKAKPILAPLAKLIGLSSGEENVAGVTFFTVRNQIICLDDLERAGQGLEEKDVLGLCSMLKEQRRCKIVLLLNDEQLSNRAEFERLLEKVVDTALSFSPTSSEASQIALNSEDEITGILRDRIVRLDIKNIRVIKKIERFANHLVDILNGFRAEVVESAINTCVLGGWSTLMPDKAPPLDFIRRFNRDVESLRQQRDGGEENARFSEQISTYGYVLADTLDIAILDGIEVGFFDAERIHDAAREIQAQVEREEQVNSFRAAWDRYHGSLREDDDVVLEGLFTSARENFQIISPTSMNATILLLREFGRNDQASLLVREYLAARNFGRGVINSEFTIWGDGPIDPEFEEGLKAIDDAFIDERDPREVLCRIATNQGWNDDDIALLAKQTPEAFERIFEGIEGLVLPKVAKLAIRMRSHEGEDYKALAAAATEGLKRIAAKSPLRARRVSSYGVRLE